MTKRFVSIALALVLVFTGSAFSAMPEDILTARPDESVYAVLKLDDTSALLKWILSAENIDTFMPLILASENSNDIIGMIELVSAVVQNTPVRSSAVIAGLTGKDDMFFQLAFTVSSEVNSIVRSISQGKATAKDIAKLLLGADNPLLSFAETMIKVENADDNILRVNNAVFMKAVDDLIVLGLSETDVKASVNALEDEKLRLSAVRDRKFKTKDFAVLHVDHKLADELNDSVDIKAANVDEIFAKPVTMEFGFESYPDRFILSSHTNLKEAMTKTYADSIKDVEAVKGGYIDLKNAGGASSPILAFGGLFSLSGANDFAEAKPYLDTMFKQLKKRFGIDKADVLSLFSGPLSVVVNGSVMFEGFKIPAVYISQTGEKGSASKIYKSLMKSRHFHEVREGKLQVDSSLSPVSCIISDAGNTLGISFAELSSFQDKPASEGAFAKLMEKESVASFWLDFAGIQAWINDDSNGVFSTLTPLASIMGYGKILESVRDVLSADLSVPSMSITVDDAETFRCEFSLKDIKPENGLFRKLIKVYREFN